LDEFHNSSTPPRHAVDPSSNPDIRLNDIQLVRQRGRL